MQVASDSKVTISYHVKKEREVDYPRLQKMQKIPSGKKAIGTCLSLEFYEDKSKQATVWYKGSITSYSRKDGYVE